uniref:MYND-type domain-containing protein n=1 Tax=Clytia hemisphaerica TaxID=252671 RepID=A0A7M5V2H7_9CNID
MKQLDEKICFDCSSSKQEMLKCSRCHAAWYCDAKCQKKDFKSHKGLCKEIGNLLAEINGENYLNQHESIRKFVTQNSENDFELWQQALAELVNLPDIMVKICRMFQPLCNLYILIASHKNAELPAEVALEWLNKALKIVAYHTEHFAAIKKVNTSKEEQKSSSMDDIFQRDDRLYFGGDMGMDGKPKQLPKTKCNTESSSEKKSRAFDCSHFARRHVLFENQPNGPADPFFCFGGEQNMPEVLVFLGRYQDAMNYIWHWSDGRFYDTYTPGAIIKRWKDWVSGNFNYDDMYKSSELVELGIRNWRKFAGEPDEGKNLMRVYGLIILIRLHTLLNADGIPDFKRKEASLDLMINPGMMTLTDSYMYYVTGREELISQMTLFKMSKGHTCRSDPRKEIHRLVWDLYKRLSQEEANFLGESYEKCIASARSWLF